MRWLSPLVACLAASLAATAPCSAENGKALEAFQPSLTAVPGGALPLGGSLYVPVYSTVAINAAVNVRFTVTLSIRNVSERAPLVLRRIAYFDTAGKQLESYLAEPVAMKPMATVEVTVPVTDSRGGSGANFVVEWAAPEGGDEPLVEALMLGNLAGASYSFTSPGRSIRAPSR